MGEATAGGNLGRRLGKALVGAIITGVAFAFGVLLGSHTQPDAGDWLSFIGALVGAGVTVAGSVYVLQWQRSSEDSERETLLLELLDDADAACAPFQVANESALKAAYDRSAAEQVAEAQAAIARIHEFRRTMQPRTARMMKVGDALAGLTFDDAGLSDHLIQLAMYPDSADFGFLNALGHDVQGKTARARALLSST